jgi:hypothetical protein
MLAGLGGTLGEGAMQTVGRDDVDDVDGGVVDDPVKGLVAVETAVGHAILGGELAELFRRAADQRRELGVLAFGETRHDDLGGVVT